MLERVEILAGRRRPPEMLRDGCIDKFFRVTGCSFKFQSAGETGRNRRRVSAARTVRRNALDKWR